MLPKNAAGLIAFATYALCIIALTYFAFMASASAASREGLIYRGYLEICVVERGQRLQCGHVRTQPYDNEAACIARTNISIAAYRAHINRTRPEALIMVQGACRVASGEYEA